MLYQAILISFLSSLAAPPAAPAALPAWVQTQWSAAGLSRQFSQTAYVKPGFLQADFNGDGKPDVAVLVTRKATRSRGIIIFHQGQANHYVLGTGSNQSAQVMFSDFSWVDHWNLFTEKKTFEVLFAKSGDTLSDREVILKHPAIEITRDEVGGGLIYWNGRKYIWLHQTC